MIVFGGREGGTTTYLQDAWGLNITVPTPTAGYVYSWERLIPGPPGAPPRRTRHSAITRSTSQTPMIVYGGLDANGPRSDVREFKKVGLNWGWTELTTSGESPGPRYGHAAVYDEDRDRMLVFGGSTVNGQLADNDVYELKFSNLTWTRLTAPGFRPSARDGHSLVVDPTARAGSPFPDPIGVTNQRVVLFGGQEGGGVQKRDVWVVWIRASNGEIQWVQMGEPSGPSARTRHAALWDQSAVGAPDPGDYDRLIVSGGDSLGSPIATTWALNGALTTWTPIASASPPLAGHTMIHYPFPLELYADVPELYTASSGTWTAQTTGRRLQLFYPFMFVLPSGNLLYAGPNHEETSPGFPSLKYAPATQTWTTLGGNTGFDGGSAVSYEPGKIMKSGSDSDPVSGTTKKINIDANDVVTSPGAGWVTSANAMQPRTFHNLTVLPTGQVLVTGGLEVSSTDAGLDSLSAFGVRQPQVWSPNGGSSQEGQWGPLLASEPVRRGYHSTALLLPDGRVISGGGEGATTNLNYNKPTIFCPPYLFNPDGSLATRPTIYSAPDTIGYGYQAMQIFTTDAPTVVSACLIRPGAVTHAFNQDQRFVPLQIAWIQDCEVRLTGPGNANEVPPGDYLLFVVNLSGVPSVAKWVRVRDGSMVGPFSVPPECPGGGGCPVVDTQTESGWRMENTILNRSKDGSLSNDVYRLKHEPRLRSGTVNLRIREDEQEATTLDQTALVTVDHPPNRRVFATSEGFMLGERRPAYRVRRETGEDLTAQMVGDGARLQGRPGDVLLVDLYAPGEEPRAYAEGMEPGGTLEFEEKQGPIGGGGGKSLQPAPGLNPAAIDAAVLDGSGIRIQVPDQAGGWRTLERRYPREHMDEGLVLSGTYTQFRLEFVGRHRLGFVGWIESRGSATGIAQPLIGGLHSSLGEVAMDLAAIDGLTTSLRPGESIELEFETSPIPAGLVRDYFLRTHGVYTALATTTDLPANSAPLRFALHQNRPNPFDQSTVIEFQLPVSGPVKLEVFDLLGRRVKTLADEVRRAGHHVLAWDRTDRYGSSVPAGVYTYRLTARGFEGQRRMVLLP